MTLLNKILFTALMAFSIIGCQKPQGFDYRGVQNIKIEKLSFNKSDISFDLAYYNPNHFGVDLKHVDCDIYINHNYLGKFTLDTVMHINKNAEFTLPSKMSIDMKKLFNNAINVLFSNTVLISVKGNTKVGKKGIYISIPFSYEGQHDLNILNN